MDFRIVSCFHCHRIFNEIIFIGLTVGVSRVVFYWIFGNKYLLCTIRLSIASIEEEPPNCIHFSRVVFYWIFSKKMFTVYYVTNRYDYRSIEEEPPNCIHFSMVKKNTDIAIIWAY